MNKIFVVCVLSFFLAVSGCSSDDFVDDSVSDLNLVDCGVAQDSVYKETGRAALFRGMSDSIQDDALSCFGEYLLSDDCVGATLVLTQYIDYFDRNATSKYRFSIFEKEDVCYIKSQFLETTRPDLESNTHLVISCPRNLSERYDDFERLGLDPFVVINTFTDLVLNDLRAYHIGIRIGFNRDGSCIVESS